MPTVAGVPLATVSRLLGHADVQSTMIYSHVDLAALRDALALHPLAKTTDPEVRVCGNTNDRADL